mmetsp:Transcript_21818/g.38884  ORF Transcript_21818/g.38884 Transcript_21818/m.38884 type:complete len:311 (+) Transcript_21818:729-1661(+)
MGDDGLGRQEGVHGGDRLLLLRRPTLLRRGARLRRGRAQVCGEAEGGEEEVGAAHHRRRLHTRRRQQEPLHAHLERRQHTRRHLPRRRQLVAAELVRGGPRGRGVARGAHAFDVVQQAVDDAEEEEGDGGGGTARAERLSQEAAESRLLRDPFALTTPRRRHCRQQRQPLIPRRHVPHRLRVTIRRGREHPKQPRLAQLRYARVRRPYEFSQARPDLGLGRPRRPRHRRSTSRHYRLQRPGYHIQCALRQRRHLSHEQLQQRQQPRRHLHVELRPKLAHPGRHPMRRVVWRREQQRREQLHQPEPLHQMT